MMEVFKIPVVFTVHDMLSLGGLAIVLGLWVLAIPVLFCLFVIKRYIKWRNEKYG